LFVNALDHVCARRSARACKRAKRGRWSVPPKRGQDPRAPGAGDARLPRSGTISTDNFSCAATFLELALDVCRAPAPTSRTNTRRLGLRRMICRHSSEPMEPPAPVTSTHFSADARPGELGFRRHRIPSQQVAHIHVAQLVDLRLAGNQVRQVRQRLNVHPEGFQLGEDLAPAAAARSGRQPPAGSGLSCACRTSSGRQSEPYTRTPLILLPCSDFLSSMNATGSKSGPPRSTELTRAPSVACPVDRHPRDRLAVHASVQEKDSGLRSGCPPTYSSANAQ